MPLTISVSSAKSAPKGAAVAVGVSIGRNGPELPAGSPSASVLAARGFEGKLGQLSVVPGRSGTTILVGLGRSADLTIEHFRSIAATLIRSSFSETTIATDLVDAAPTKLDRAAVAQALTEGALLASYQFSTYKSQHTPRALTSVVLTGRVGRLVDQGIRRGVVIAGAVALNRDLVNEPAMTLTPAHFADLAIEVAASKSLTVRVWDEDDIERERLGGIRGVSLGSTEPPRLVKLTYTPTGATKRTPTLALVGKGITFDSGGMSMKTSDGMLTMKCDMSGAGAVLGVMSVLAELDAPVRVVGYCCLSENMPGPAAFKLLDVLTARNGKTVEIYNTDAEGRLVLMDGLSLAVEDGANAIIDLATLTGAAVVALGTEITAVMGNHQGFIDHLREAATTVGEDTWQLPLPSRYRKQLESPIADLKNIGNPGQAGSSVAGLFLQEFVGSTPWIHLDIAGPAFTNGDDGIITRGGTGVMVRTLLELIANFEVPTR
jgi:leucyl aminopeptidase